MNRSRYTTMRNSRPIQAPSGRDKDVELTEQNALQLMNREVRQLALATSQPGKGRGIVICGGGQKYFPCAWVCINMLRRNGCQLPIELWHLGESELNATMRQLCNTVSVNCVDALKDQPSASGKGLGGWELKPFALLHSRFREVLLLDADNVPIADPTYLFDSPQFSENGAVFWPDISRPSPAAKIWDLTGLPYEPGWQFDTGQILVDKQICFSCLKLTMWMNENSDFWYRYLYGDKETFQIAWRKLGKKYAMPTRHVQMLPKTLCQHDFDGRRIFQHRNASKWLIRRNVRIRGFEQEQECLRILDELAPIWREIGGVGLYGGEYKNPSEKEAARYLMAYRWEYRAPDQPVHIMTFAPDGCIGIGIGEHELYWDICEFQGQIYLDIESSEHNTCQFKLETDGEWQPLTKVREHGPFELGRADINGDEFHKSHDLSEIKFVNDFFQGSAVRYFAMFDLCNGMRRRLHSLIRDGWEGVCIEPLEQLLHDTQEAEGAVDTVKFLNTSIIELREVRNSDIASARLRNKLSDRACESLRLPKNNRVGYTPSLLNNTDIKAQLIDKQIQLLCVGERSISDQLMPMLLQKLQAPELILYEAAKFPEQVLWSGRVLCDQGYIKVFECSTIQIWGRCDTDSSGMQ
jgi:hypothetical protein